MRTTSRSLVWLQVLFTVVWVLVWSTIWMAPMEACLKQHAVLNCDVLKQLPGGSDAWFWRFPDALGLGRLGIVGKAIWSVLLFPAVAWALLGFCSFAARLLWPRREQVSD